MKKETKTKHSFWKSTRNRVIAGAVAVAVMFGFAGINGSNVEAAFSKEADTTTLNSYQSEDFLGHPYSTEYAGRIWTDKSVVEIESDGDFKVTYSALATTQQVTGQTNAPLDVVFVIDISGSMSNGSSYMDDGDKRIENLVEALNDSVETIMDMNEYTRVGVVAFSNSATTLLPLDHYTKYTSTGWNSKTYDYFTLSSDGTELYTRAVNSKNRDVEKDVSVTGGTNIQQGIYTGMSLLTDSNNSATVNVNGQTVNRIPAVIVLSDGAPTYSAGAESWWNLSNPGERQGPGNTPYYGNGFKAIMTAAYMKQQITNKYTANNTLGDAYKAKVYTVGIGIADLSNYNQYYSYTGEKDLAYLTLNPSNYWSDSDRANNMAKQMSTAWNQYRQTNGDNTPSVSVNSGSTYEVKHPNTGDIKDNSNAVKYNDGYYGANNATGVTNVFNDIVSTLSLSVPEIPTEVHVHDTLAEESGYITYRDPIGEFMELKDIVSLEYNGTVYTEHNQPVKEEGKTVYTFEAPITTSIGTSSNLNHISIILTEDNVGKQELEVKIPGALIPLRINKVDLNKDGQVAAHTHNNAQPFRLNYTVGLVDEIKTTEGTINLHPNFNSNDKANAYQAYLDTHASADGTVNFYSNYYDGSNVVNGHTAGNATVEFEPSHTNNFYYMQAGNPIYYYNVNTGTAGNRVPNGTAISDNGSYCYKGTYYHQDDIVEKVSVYTGAQIKSVGAVKGNDGYWVGVPGTPRVIKILTFEGTKTTNDTNTASDFYAPTFKYAEGSSDPYAGKFVVYHGNNGVLSAKLTGALEISKNVTAAESLTAPNSTFEFTLTLKESESGPKLTGVYECDLIDTISGTSLERTVKSGETITLAHGQIFRIMNLPDGAVYSVTENGVSGFTPKVGNEAVDTATGKIQAGNISKADFTNHYSASATIGGFAGQKILTGRNWKDNDEFTFRLEAALTTPMPDDSIIASEGTHRVKEITVKKSDATITPKTTEPDTADFGFGEITYTKVGNYEYIISEKIPTSGTGGMTYSAAMYRVSVQVEDILKNGTLTVTAAMVKIVSDDGTDIADEAVLDNVAKFTNSYSAQSTSWVPVGTKHLVDQWGQDVSLAGKEFSFKVKPGSPNAPMPVGSTNEIIVQNAGSEIKYAEIVFTQSDVGTHTYLFSEVSPDGTVNNTYNGIIYDTNEYEVNVTVSINDNDEVVYTVDYPDNWTRVHFTNTYVPTPVKLSTETNNPLTGTKTLTGREWKEGESFKFNLNAADETTINAIKDNQVVVKDLTANEITTATILDFETANKNAQTFKFNDITFKKAGTYKFNISEVKGNQGGITYDEHVTVATVVVTEIVENNQPKLTASVTYNNGNVSTDITQAQFVNTYESVFDKNTTVNINGTKTLNGRSLKAGEFFFDIEAKDNAPLGDTEASTTNKEDGSIALLKNITYTEAGVYEYILKEHIPSAAQKLGGITYDNVNAYKVIVTVTDDLNGNLRATSAIYKSVDGGETFAQNPLSDIEKVEFVNTYTTENALYTPVNLKKVVEGRELLEGETYNFVMSEVSDPEDGMLLPANTIASNDANGNITFGDITFTKPGKYVVQIKEMIPEKATAENNYTVDGITYDTHAAIASFVVVDDGYGKLVAARKSLQGLPIFTNKYQSTGELTGLTVTKNFTGRDNNKWLENDEFTFVLEPSGEDTKTAIANGTIQLPVSADATGKMEITIADSDETKTKKFDDITFNKAGTYTFVLYEKTDNKLPGVHYDDVVRIVTVTAADKGNGVLDIGAEVTGGSETIFNNTYSTGTAEFAGWTGLKVDKILSGREWQNSDEFEFTLSAATADSTGINEEGNSVAEGNASISTNVAVNKGYVVLPDETTITMTKDNRDILSFGNIIFKKAGTYTFEIKEVKPDENDSKCIPGIDYSLETKKVVVVVTDNGQGALVAAKDSQGSKDVTFVNTYKADPGELKGEDNLKITKEFTGRAWGNTEFQFKLSVNANHQDTVDALAAGKIILPGTNEFQIISIGKPESGTANSAFFGNITFNEVGTYSFVIEEINGGTTENGIAYDGHKVYVTVVVTEGLDDNNEHVGELIVTPSYMGSMTFSNTYTPTPTSASLRGEKVLNGREFKSGDRFLFTISVAEGSEENTPLPAMTRITTSSWTQDEINNGVDNTYTRPIDFGNITYTKKGTYIYDIVEEHGTIAGVVYDTEKVTATVKVKENEATGELQVESIAYVKGASGTKFEFNNVYDAHSSDPITLQAKKVVDPLDGNSFTMQGGEFKFELVPTTEVTGDPIGGKITAYNDANGNVSFSPDGLVYTQEGEYSYTVREVSNSLPGMKYDATIYTIKVKVTDLDADGNHTGKLKTDVEIKKGNGEQQETATEIIFKNEYKPAIATFVISGMKKMDNNYGKVLGNNMFKFTLEPIDNAPMPKDGKETVENIGGVFSFGEIEYEKPGTYEYFITEVNGGDATITYDTTKYKVVVVVEDAAPELATYRILNQELIGEDEEEVPPTGGGEEVPPTGGEEVPPTGGEEVPPTGGEEEVPPTGDGGEVPPTGDGGEVPPTGDGGEVPPVEGGEEVPTSEDEYKNLSPVIAFRTIKMNWLKQPLGGAGEQNDPIVEITFGALKATGSYYKVGSDGDGKVDEVVFENGYTPSPLTTVEIEGKKVLEGRALKEGEFTFLLQKSDGADGVVTVAEGKNDVADDEKRSANFKITLPESELQILSQRTGEYVYTLVEKDEGLGGITYSNVVCRVKITVKDDNGTLKATVSYNDSSNIPEFTNEYSADPTEVDFSGTKVLHGRSLKEEEFKFELKAIDTVENGTTITTASDTPMPGGTAERVIYAENDVEGKVAFGKITYNNAGVYTYQISEVEGDLKNVTYDKTVYTYVVTVTDNELGKLEADCQIVCNDPEKTSLVFTNTYKEPPKPKDPEPEDEPKDEPEIYPAPKQPVQSTGTKTGDSANLGGLFGLLAAAVAGFFGIKTYKRKKQ